MYMILVPGEGDFLNANTKTDFKASSYPVFNPVLF
jgi:hypothetical protein